MSSGRYSVTLSEDDFRRNVLNEAKKREKLARETVVQNNDAVQKLEEKPKTQTSKAVSPVKKESSKNNHQHLSEDNMYRRFSNSKYFNWNDSSDDEGFNKDTDRTTSPALTDSPKKKPNKSGGCALCKFARDAVEREIELEILKRKEELKNQPFQSGHCFDLEQLHKLLQKFN